jgi:hypothetical protein
MAFREIFLGPAEASERLTWLQRKETWNGEAKANRIRMVALAIFGLNEILNYSVFHVVDWRFHVGSLLIVFIWFLFAAIFQWMLRHHFLPRSSSFLMASVDVSSMTWLLLFADGPKSPLVGIYFLIIALSGYRLNPPLTLYTSGASVFGYLVVLEFVKRHAPLFKIPRMHETLVVLCLLLMGMVMTHLVSRVLNLLHTAMSEQGGK